jgi:hypothetical protein
MSGMAAMVITPTRDDYKECNNDDDHLRSAAISQSACCFPSLWSLSSIGPSAERCTILLPFSLRRYNRRRSIVMPQPKEIVDVEIVGGPRVTIAWSKGMNAQNGLEEAFRVINNTTKFTYALQYFGSSLGYLVLMMNETYDSFISASSPFFYWEILVNGTPATTGIDHIMLQPGDHLMFTFERYDPVKHAASTLKAKYEHQIHHGDPAS